MPSANVPHVFVFRIRHANDNASLRAEIKEAAKQQNLLGCASPYRRRGRTLTGDADPNTPKRRIKQNLNNVARRGRTHGLILARHGEHTFKRTSAAAGSGRVSRPTALKYEPQAAEEEPLILQSKKREKVKQCTKKKLGAKNNRQGKGQHWVSVDDTLTSVTQIGESKNQLSRLPMTSSVPLASHHPTSGSFRLISPANSSGSAYLDNDIHGEAGPRKGDNAIHSGGEKVSDHSGHAYHSELTTPTMPRLIRRKPVMSETIPQWDAVQNKPDIGKATTMNTYETVSEQAIKDWYSPEASTDPLTATDWDHRPLSALQQQITGKSGDTPEYPPSRDIRARSGVMAYGDKIKRKIMRCLDRKHKTPCREPRHEKVRSIHAWRERVAGTRSILAENSVTTTEVDCGSSNFYAIGTSCKPAELAGDDSDNRCSAPLFTLPGGIAEAANGTRCTTGKETFFPSPQSVARHPHTITLGAQEADSGERYEIGVQEGSIDKSARHRFRDHPLFSAIDHDEHDPSGPVGSHIPRLSSFRTKDELCRYLRPEAAELPAYEEVMRKDTNTPAAICHSRNSIVGANDQGSCGASGRAPTKPEDMWLYTPRSCTKCGDFGLLPLHYCAECKKLRVDMCTECYSMGHDTCQQAGHDVLETGRMQDIPNHKSKTASVPSSRGDSVIKVGTEAAPLHILDKFLTFLTEDRSYMRDEVRRARSYTAVRQQMAVDDRAEARASRTAKLKALPALITKEEERRMLEIQKSLRSVREVAHPLRNDGDTDASQVDANPALQTPESLERGSLERKLSTLRRTIPNTPDSCLQDDLQKDVLSPGALPSRARQRELSDMDSRLQLQEQLQSFRDREISLREKELELRDRESALQLNEKRSLQPDTLDTSLRETGHSSLPRMTSSLPCELKCQPGPVKPSLPAPGSTSKRSCLDSNFQSPLSTLSMSHYDSYSWTSSPSGSTVPPARDGYQVSSMSIKQFLSKFFLRRTRKGIRTRTGKRARQDDSLQHTKSSSKFEPGSSCTPRKRARKSVLARRHSERSDRSGTDSGSNKRCKKNPSTKAISGRLLACPYAKFDPFRYSSCNQDEPGYRGCSTHYLRNIPRLKQHLYRVHQRPEHHCPRCFEVFDSELDVSAHARLAVRCATVPCPFDEKFDDDQLKELKRRRQGTSEKDCWFSIYRVLFPNATLPADPYPESPAALLTSQLTSPGFSETLGESVVARAGLDPESEIRVLQAIRESLPRSVQQLLQHPSASTSSSSTSLLESSTTPASSSGNDLVGPDVQDNMSGPGNALRTSDPRASEYSCTPGPRFTGHNPPNSSAGRLVSQQRSTYLQTPAHATNNHVRTNTTYTYTGAYTTDPTRMILTRRQPSSEFRVDSHDRLNGNGQSAAAPMAILPNHERRNITDSSIRASNSSVTVMAPPPVRQQVVHATTLKPRRSVDSGYASMHTVTSGDGVLIDPATSNISLPGINEDMLSGNSSGAINNQGSIRLDETDGRTENQTFENDQINQIYDPSTGAFSMTEQDFFAPYTSDYSAFDAGFMGRASNSSGLGFPPPLDQELTPDLYGMVDDLSMFNPWG